MAKGPRGKAPAPAEEGRKEYQLDDAASDELRAAIENDDGDPDKGDPVAKFWTGAGVAMGFDPESLVLVEMPESGPVRFTAKPVGDAAAGGEPQPDLPQEAAPLGGEGIDAEAETNAGLERMEAAAESMELESATLVGDLTLGLVEVIKNLQKPWSAHSQHEKRDLVAKIEHIAKITARQAVDVVAAEGRITVKAIIEKIAIGDKVMITAKLAGMPEDEMSDAITQLYHCQKKSVLIVTADADQHMGKRREAVEPDEIELPFAADDPPPPPADDSDLAGGADEDEDQDDESGGEPEEAEQA